MTTYYPGTGPSDAERPDPDSLTCANCEHSLIPSRHTLDAVGNGPNGTNSYTCLVCGPESGTHHQGQRGGLTEPRRTTRVVGP